MSRRTREGHSLVELLVCIAIISILAAMYLPALSKARRKAEEVAIREGFRQEAIGRAADTVNSVRSGSNLPATRDAYRAAYRQQLGTVNGQVWVTELLCEVGSEAEFRAYWNTVINPDATGALEFSGGALVAYDESGNKYLLREFVPLTRVGAAIPVAWEFISTNLQETSAGTLGTNVAYSDGHTQYVRYPGEYPASRTVAELSHRYMQSIS